MTDRKLPKNVTVQTVGRSGGLFISILTDEKGILRRQIFGKGDTREESVADLTEEYYAKLYDKRSDSKIKGSVWLHMAGQTAIRVAASEKADYLAKGYTEGKGKTGQRPETLAKLAEQGRVAAEMLAKQAAEAEALAKATAEQQAA